MFGGCKPECNPCGTSDPVADRVMVDPASLMSEKENEPPSTNDKLAEQRAQEEERRKREDERKRKEREAAEAERKRAEAEAAAKAKEEEERKAKEAEELQRQAAAKESQRRKEEEEQKRLQQLKEEALREQQAKDEAERQRVELEVATRKANKFMKDNNFGGINTKKSSIMSGSKYALHAAVEKKDVESLRALLRSNADPTQQNSSKKTPQQLAESLNKKGSHAEVLTVLQGAK